MNYEKFLSKAVCAMKPSGIRKYFDDQLVNMDGTDTAVWNALVGLGEGIVDDIIEVMEKYLKEFAENHGLFFKTVCIEDDITLGTAVGALVEKSCE